MPPYNISKVDSPVRKQVLEMADDTIPANDSEQRLVGYENISIPASEGSSDPPARMTRHQIITVVVLCYVNLINYMDRYTVAGILPDITKTFGMTQAQAGLLQTAFVLVYMVMAPTYGFLGDRYNRKYLMAFGVFFWSTTTLVGSFMPNYAGFLVFRCLVGVGEASYSTIAPTIISDLFVKDQRSKMLAFFYFAIPVGSGMGYMVGAEVTNLAKMVSPDNEEAWRWGLRVTPIMGAIAVALILAFIKETPRGEVEGGQHIKTTNFCSDLKYLATNKSYVLNTIAFTCVTFVAGALAYWGPTFIQMGVEVQDHPNVDENSVPFVFGAIAMCAGLVGVPLGSFSGTKLRKRWGFADAMVCGAGLLFSFPLLMVSLFLTNTNTMASYVVVFFGQIFLNLNWAVVSDIVLYIVIPTRRSSAEAFQILFSHALGDAGSPLLVGLMSDYIKPMFENNTSNYTDNLFLSSDMTDYSNFTTTEIPLTAVPTPDDKYAEFKALQASLYACCSFLVFGAVFFFISCFFVTKDKQRADRIIAGATNSSRRSGGDSTDTSSLEEEAAGHPTHRYADDPQPEQTQHLLV